MIDAKEGKIDIEHFKYIINEKTTDHICYSSTIIYVWILKFFANQKKAELTKLDPLMGILLILTF